MSRKEAPSIDRPVVAKRRIPRRRHLGWVVGALVVIALVVTFRMQKGDDSASAQAPQGRARRGASTQQAGGPRTGRPQHDVMAIVNGQDIGKRELANACIQRFGEEVLESMVNKYLVRHHCRKRGIKVTPQELDAEVNQLAQRLNLKREQYLDVLLRERGISPGEYRNDILWPLLALRKLAADQLQVSNEEIAAAYQRQFGPAVRARVIVVEDAALANKLRADLVANPDDFARLAIEHSVDVNSASIGGLIQPIRANMGEPLIEQVLFSLREGEISKVLNFENLYAIYKCEGHDEARNVPLAAVRGDLIRRIEESKLRETASKLFDQLQGTATIRNVYNDETLSRQMPGVVATVNGDPISLKALGEACLLRHGQEVLEQEVNHLLLSQALKSHGLRLTEEDIDTEIAHAAVLADVVDDQGQPDIGRWLAMAVEEGGLPEQLYIRDHVWPSAALKKLTQGQIKIETEDLKKSFVANYGQRVQCRAIVLGNQRRAQQVWDLARRNPTVEYFGQLAAEYSIEPSTKALRGEVPPIQQYGGRPDLEKAAFELNPGDVSRIVNLQDKYIILFCEGRTTPMDVRFEEVRDILYRDIHEKKVRIAMAEKFDEILSSAQIDNYLAGTTRSPQRAGGVRPAPGATRPDPAVRPAATAGRRSAGGAIRR